MSKIFDRSKGRELEQHYGIKRQRLIRDSGVRNVFTPRSPIRDVNLFSGRTLEVEKLLEYITSPGLHALLYGDRGVGKSSLANITTALLLKDFHTHTYKRSCSTYDTFESIFEEPLSYLGYTLGVTTREYEERVEGGASVNLGLIKSNVKGGESEKTLVTQNRELIKPSDLATVLRSHDALMVIDEIDRLKKVEIEKIAELIKLLSDSSSQFKLLLVGIAHNSSELIGGHLSVQRCLMQTNLAPMPDQELKKIITDGEEQIKPPLSFTEVAKLQIVQLSSGYPHFTHLLALKAAEEAICDERRSVTISDVVLAISSARGEAEEGLRAKYDEAIDSDSSGLTQRILISVAKSLGQEYTFHEIKRMVKSIFSEEPTDAKLRYRLSKISSELPDSILRTKPKRKYIINDPRMLSFIRIMNTEYFQEYLK